MNTTKLARSLTDELMDCVDRLGSEADSVDPRVWSHLLVYAPRLWLWQNGDHFWAFDNLYPCFMPGGDPMTLGEPVGYAIFKASHCRASPPPADEETGK